MVTVKEVVDFAKDLANRGVGVDQDGAYGTQCVDLPNYISSHYFGKALWGNAINLLDSAKKNGYQVFYMPTEENPKAGDVFVTKEAHQYGHTGLVIKDSDGWTMDTIEQNIDGNADSLSVGGPARYVKGRGFGNVVGWFRFPYSNEPTQKNTDFLVRVSIQNLNVRQAPSLSAKRTGFAKTGVYTITETKTADGYEWGKLKSGIGWIALKYTNRL